MNHFNISIIKSAIRILGSVASIATFIIGLILWNFNVTLISSAILAASYGIAEVLGILEEIYDTRKEE